jgi:ankyrin repeat protein
MRALFVLLAFTFSFSLAASAQETIFSLSRTNDTSNVSKFLQNDATLVNFTDEKGFSPLLLAAYNDKFVMVSFLLKNGADVNYSTSQGSILHSVAYKGNTEIAKLLIDKGANVDTPDQNGTTPLHYATMFSHNELATVLVKKGANPLKKDGTGQSALDYAKSLKNKQLTALFKAVKIK